MNIERLKKTIELYEGRSAKPYKDTQGKITIGIGRNLDDVGLSSEEIEFLFENDLVRAIGAAKILIPNFDELDSVRQEILINMAFNLGQGGLAKFRRMIEAIKKKDFENAANEMLDSQWSKQVGIRALDLAKAMKSGKF